MRVAVICPPYPLEESPAPPLGVCYVAAAFETAGAEVKIVDYLVSRYTREKLKAQLDFFQPDALGSTSVTLNFPGAAEIVQEAKELRPSLVTMMGGPHVSFDAENTLRRYPGIDLIVIGEGEATIRELTPLLPDRRAWRRVKGIAYLEDGRYVQTEPREPIQDLDSLPLPARHLLNVSRYQALGFPVSIITGRGCPYPCIFCQGRRMVGKQVRYRDPVKVVDEIEAILASGFPRINVADDLFVSQKERTRAVCQEILDRGIQFGWSAFARVNTVDLETLKLMRRAGCDAISYGLESGNQEMLNRLRKGITLDMVRRATGMAKEAGLICHGSFMVGLPGETWQTMQDTEDFAESLGILYGYHFLAPFPGTTVREEVGNYDLEILTDDWTRYDANSAIVRTSALSPEDIERFVAGYMKRTDLLWEEMVRDYHAGTITGDAGLRVLGKYRMEITFRLLNEDLIERFGQFSNGNLGPGAKPPESVLAERITTFTGQDREMTASMIKEFKGRGCIDYRKNGDGLTWFWTHSPKQTFGPFSLTQARLGG